MRRLPPGLLVALFSILLVAGGVADRAMVQRARDERQAAAEKANETARLTAQSVRAALARIEQDVVAGRTPDGVTSERLALPAERSAYTPVVPYGRRPRSELAELLDSRASTPGGLPEAVVARMALGDVRLTLGNAARVPVVERLLNGDLPIDPEDLPHLARLLGAGSDLRVGRLQARLRQAPDVSSLPRLPGFRRRLTTAGTVEGWSRSDRERLSYDLPVVALLERAGVADRAWLPAEHESGAVAPVPDVEGFGLKVESQVPSGLRTRALRALLWLAIGGSVAGLLVIRRTLDRELRAVAREKAFLGNVTHELRSPLASIRLLGETLAGGRGDAREYGALVSQEAERLDALVERVLAVTRIDEAPSFGRVRPADLLRSAVTPILPRAERRAVSVECHLGDDGLPEATWDEDAVRRALMNLVDNAITHGRHGGKVEVRAEREGEAVRFSVADDGPGIGRHHRRSIFGRFRRGDTESPGTGLGLYLVEQVARAHGGRVDLETEENRGSTFSLLLPLRPPGSAAAPEGEAPE